MYVVLILTFFCMLFWAFYEQAGSSINNFTDRNVQRVFASATVRIIGPEDVGKTIRLQPTQEQLGYHNGEQMFTLDVLNKLRATSHRRRQKDKDFEIDWKVAEDNVGMRIVRRDDEIPASLFQAVNPVYIMLLGLVFSAAVELPWQARTGTEHAAEVRPGAACNSAWGSPSSGSVRNWPTSGGWSPSAGCCWATCSTRPANFAFRPWGSR